MVPGPTREEQLRYRLRQDPNDGGAFTELVALLHARTPDPGRGSGGAGRGKGSLADVVWALGEELAQHPRAWRPLIEVALLLVESDVDDAVRRLDLACRRDCSGQALARSLAALRGVPAPDHAVRLGLAHYRRRFGRASQAAAQLLCAAAEAGRLDQVEPLVGLSLPTRPETGAVDLTRQGRWRGRVPTIGY